MSGELEALDGERLSDSERNAGLDKLFAPCGECYEVNKLPAPMHALNDNEYECDINNMSAIAAQKMNIFCDKIWIGGFSGAAVTSFSAEGLFSNPHLLVRGAIAHAKRPRLGKRRLVSSSQRMFATMPARVRSAPLLGGNYRYVLEELHRISGADVSSLPRRKLSIGTGAGENNES